MQSCSARIVAGSVALPVALPPPRPDQPCDACVASTRTRPVPEYLPLLPKYRGEDRAIQGRPIPLLCPTTPTTHPHRPPPPACRSDQTRQTRTHSQQKGQTQGSSVCVCA